MSRRSLRPQLNQIRGWVRQGRTNAWIAHQLEVTVQQVETFKRQHSLDSEGDDTAVVDEQDLRSLDDAAIAEELEKAEAEAAKKREKEMAEEEERKADEAKSEPTRTRRRTSRSRRRDTGQVFEGTFDHGEEGYGLWLDPAVEDSRIYAEHWAGHRPIEVTIEQDQIIIKRAESSGEEDSES